MRPRSRFVIPIATLLLLLSAPVSAQLDEHPGYFPVEELDFLTQESLSLEVNLGGAMLELIASALDDEDPGFSELVRGLVGISVRIADVEELDLSAMREGFGRATTWLEDNGWETFVRLREDDEELYVFMRQIDGDMMGATVLVLEPEDQVVFVNVVGKLDLKLLASLADSFDIPQLDVAGLSADEDEAEPGEQPEERPER